MRSRPGIYRVPGEPRWPTTVAGSRWHAAHVEPADDLPQAYDEIARALALPGWFGANLDALWDCLTDLRTPTALLWRRWDALENAHPLDSGRLLEVLRDRTAQAPDFAVVLGGSAAGTGSRSSASSR
ncbi:MAG: barstar family protein [Propionibacteriaceae bacterium]